MNTFMTTTTITLHLQSLWDALSALSTAAMTAIETQARSLVHLCSSSTNKSELQLLSGLMTTGDRLDARVDEIEAALATVTAAWTLAQTREAALRACATEAAAMTIEDVASSVVNRALAVKALEAAHRANKSALLGMYKDRLASEQALVADLRACMVQAALMAAEDRSASLCEDETQASIEHEANPSPPLSKSVPLPEAVASFRSLPAPAYRPFWMRLSGSCAPLATTLTLQDFAIQETKNQNRKDVEALDLALSDAATDEDSESSSNDAGSAVDGSCWSVNDSKDGNLDDEQNAEDLQEFKKIFLLDDASRLWNQQHWSANVQAFRAVQGSIPYDISELSYADAKRLAAPNGCPLLSQLIDRVFAQDALMLMRMDPNRLVAENLMTLSVSELSLLERRALYVSMLPFAADWRFNCADDALAAMKFMWFSNLAQDLLSTTASSDHVAPLPTDSLYSCSAEECFASEDADVNRAAEALAEEIDALAMMQAMQRARETNP